MMIKNKKKYGQFYTSNHDYILQGLKILEPFTGNGELINFIKKDSSKVFNIECYDIDPPFEEIKEYKLKIIKQDTIKYPPNYSNKFLITNPPYLARNKSEDKLLFDKYNVNDLYKCVIKEITNNNCYNCVVLFEI